ncbi:unnamed protein product [Amoebophrya sp. A120]|nr:unnamed protein product [Amoebophrya sp. A120]|eukprot:GSA120T00020464001.1
MRRTTTGTQQGFRPGPGAAQQGFNNFDRQFPDGPKPGLQIGQKFAVSAAWATAFVLFTVVFSVLSFSYHNKFDTFTVALIGLFFAALYGFPGGEVRVRQTVWRWMPLLACSGAVLLAVWLGETNYHWYQRHFFDLEYGHLHTGVAATNAALMYKDAAVLRFSADSRLDYTRTLGLKKDGSTYCVAPVMSDSLRVEDDKPYSFWAVGLNCCDEKLREFTCGSTGLGKVFGSVEELAATKTGILATYSSFSEQGIDEEKLLYLNAIRMARARFALPQWPAGKDAIFMLNWSKDPFQDKTDFRTGALLFFWIWFLLFALQSISRSCFFCSPSTPGRPGIHRRILFSCMTWRGNRLRMR